MRISLSFCRVAYCSAVKKRCDASAAKSWTANSTFGMFAKGSDVGPIGAGVGVGVGVGVGGGIAGSCGNVVRAAGKTRADANDVSAASCNPNPNPNAYAHSNPSPNWSDV